jgi:hypothetical protein
MFGLYFGHYLVDKNKISQSQLDNIMQQHHETRAKLGLIAVAEKILTKKQSEEINEIQKKMDSRFGDIAIEKGYLLQEEVTYLLNLQGNSYLRFIQLFTEQNILSLNEIEALLEEFKNDNQFTALELDALKSGDIDRIIPIFVKVDTQYSGECFRLAIHNLIRFIDSDVVLKKAYKVRNYSFASLASQQMKGDNNIFVGFAGNDSALIRIASSFAKEQFKTLDEDAYDSVCEFINCINGLFASKLSYENIQIDITPPCYYTNKTLTTEGDIYIVPTLINGEQTDVVVVVNDSVVIN